MQNAIASYEIGQDLWECEGTLKPLIASHKHNINVVAANSTGTPSTPWQIEETLKALKPSRYILAVDAGCFNNTDVFNKILKTIEFISKLRDKLGQTFEIFVADWKQFFATEGQREFKDVDEIDTLILKRCTLVPASIFSVFKDEFGTIDTPQRRFSYIYIEKQLLHPPNSTKTLSESTFDLYTATDTEFENEQKILAENIDISFAKTQNLLFSRFIAQEKLTSEEYFEIAVNLAGFKGGEKVYQEYLHSDYLEAGGRLANIKNFVAIARQMKVKKGHLFELLRTSSVLRLKQPVTIPADEAYEILKNNFNSALTAVIDGSIYSNNADTGIGKTRLVLENLKSGRLNNCVIAFKTHTLKDDFAGELKGLTYKKQIELKLPEALTKFFNKLYACGLNSVVYQILTELANFGTSRYPSKHDSTILKMDTHAKAYGVKPTYIQFDGLVEATNDVDKGVREHIREYLAVNKELCSSECELPKLVTHDFLLYRAKAFRGIPIIIDEDFTNSLYHSVDLNIGDITNIAHSSDRIDFWGKKLVGELEVMKEFSTLDITHINPDFSDIEKSIYTYSLNLDVAVLYSATRVLKLEKGQFTFYVDKDVLPLTNNYIQLSATPRNDILKQKYGDRVKVLETPTVALKGKIRQVVDVKTSKTQLRKLEDFNNLQKLVADDIVITHKEFKKHFKADSKCHHGNVEGYNHLTGQNISFVGELKLPHQALIKQFVGAGFSLKGRSLRLIKNQLVTFNNYRFGLHSFEDKDLLQFQLEAINAQQEQAVGRARLVRTEAIATVIAHFPLLQSKIISSQELIEQRDTETLAIASVKIEELETATNVAETIIKEELVQRNEQTTERNSTISTIQSCIENSDQARCSDNERQSAQTELEAFVQKKLEGNNFDLQTTKLFILFYQDTGNSQPIEEMLENEMFLASSVRQFRNTPDAELEKLTIGKAIAK